MLGNGLDTCCMVGEGAIKYGLPPTWWCGWEEEVNTARRVRTHWACRACDRSFARGLIVKERCKECGGSGVRSQLRACLLGLTVASLYSSTSLVLAQAAHLAMATESSWCEEGAKLVGQPYQGAPCNGIVGQAVGVYPPPHASDEHGTARGIRWR
jgi:hypothetical protein